MDVEKREDGKGKGREGMVPCENFTRQQERGFGRKMGRLWRRKTIVRKWD